MIEHLKLDLHLCVYPPDKQRARWLATVELEHAFHEVRAEIRARAARFAQRTEDHLFP